MIKNWGFVTIRKSIERKCRSTYCTIIVDLRKTLGKGEVLVAIPTVFDLVMVLRRR